MKAKSILTFVNPLTIEITLKDGRKLVMHPKNKMAEFDEFFALAEELRVLFKAPKPKRSRLGKKLDKRMKERNK